MRRIGPSSGETRHIIPPLLLGLIFVSLGFGLQWAWPFPEVILLLICLPTFLLLGRSLQQRIPSPIHWWKHPDFQRLLIATGILISVVGGLLLRVDGILSSLWIDEFGTFWAVEGSFLETWHRAIAFHGQTPLYYLLTWVPLHLFGESELVLRSSSVLFSLALWGVMYWGIREAFGSTAALFSIPLAAFNLSLVRFGPQARPYSLALLLLTLAVVGFLRAGLRNDLKGRMLWVFGGAGTAWAHYLIFPIVIGLSLAYLILPQLKTRYSPKFFFRDLSVQFVLVAMTFPHLHFVLMRQNSLDWIQSPQHFAFIFLLFPMALPLVYGELIWRRNAGIHRSLRDALWIAVIFNLLVLEGCHALGINLLYSRYLLGLVIPALILASSGLARCKPARAFEGLVWTTLCLVYAHHSFEKRAGSYSGLGWEDWRQAVSVLDSQLNRRKSVAVLFRSGFVEEDQVVIGSQVPTVLSPLRSPGEASPPWEVVPLGYLWGTAERREYFDHVVFPRLQGVHEFYFIGKGAEFTAKLIEWVDGTWPGRFHRNECSFGAVKLLHFQEGPDEELQRASPKLKSISSCQNPPS